MFSAFFIKNPVFSAVVSIVILLAGAASMATLPIEPVTYTHLRAHETKANIGCRHLLEKITLY